MIDATRTTLAVMNTEQGYPMSNKRPIVMKGIMMMIACYMALIHHNASANSFLN